MHQIDLHIHSTYSDGTDTVEQIMKKSKEKKLDLIAVTDHNTLSHIIDVKRYSKIYHQDVVAGIELSCMYQNKEIHVLGYFPIDEDFHDKKFHDLWQYIDEYKQIKVIQNEAILLKLKEKFSDISLGEFYQYSNSQNMNRVHIAKYMVYKGYVHDIDEAFLKYIGSDCPFYVKRKEISLQKAIKSIKNADGLAVIAHLGEYQFHSQEINDFIEKCLDYKVDGFECYHPLNHQQVVKTIQNYHHMILTAGSDYHGFHKKNNFLGISYDYDMNENEFKQYKQTIEKTYQLLRRWMK